MNQEPLPPPPKELLPWYYQNLFLAVAFVLWPSWSILILRSPWHNGILSGGVAWAALILGTVLGVRSVAEGSGGLVIVFYVPGLVLTLGTQIHWAGYKRQFIDPLYAAVADQMTSASPDADGEARLTRRARPRRRPRSGRTSHR